MNTFILTLMLYDGGTYTVSTIEVLFFSVQYLYVYALKTENSKSKTDQYTRTTGHKLHIP